MPRRTRVDKIQIEIERELALRIKRYALVDGESYSSILRRVLSEAVGQPDFPQPV